jgi:hypothetical protein
MERAQRRLEPHRVVRADAAHPELADALLDAGLHRPFGEPAGEAVAHLAGRGAGEGDGEDVVRLDAGEQQPDDARHQHPGLARAGAGLDHDALAGSQAVA